MDNSNITSAVLNAAGKKRMKKGLRVALIVMSAVFFLAAIVTPIVVFSLPRNKGYQETTIGDFVLRYDNSGDFYDIVSYNGDDT